MALVQHTTDVPDYSPIDLAIFHASRGDAETASEMVRPGWDSVSKDAPLTEVEWTAFRAQLLRRGIVLVDGDDGHFYATEAACCIWCHGIHSVDDPHAACAGPIPLDEVTDDTAGLCQVCGKAVNGPPTFCCPGRKRLVDALHGEDFPIRPCGLCHGAGEQPVGQPCSACDSTGVAL